MDISIYQLIEKSKISSELSQEDLFLFLQNKFQSFGYLDPRTTSNFIEEIVQNAQGNPDPKSYCLEKSLEWIRMDLANRTYKTTGVSRIDSLFPNLLVEYQGKDFDRRIFASEKISPTKMIPRKIEFSRISGFRKDDWDKLETKTLIGSLSFWIVVYSLILYFFY